jgi:hypothetical protein
MCLRKRSTLAAPNRAALGGKRSKQCNCRCSALWSRDALRGGVRPADGIFSVTTGSVGPADSLTTHVGGAGAIPPLSAGGKDPNICLSAETQRFQLGTLRRLPSYRPPRTNRDSRRANYYEPRSRRLFQISPIGRAIRQVTHANPSILREDTRREGLSVHALYGLANYVLYYV